ncbi:ABC transporter substrate-binding protein [Pseudonocardia endophytica]|nr:transporter substrate-binding domain-containing protein [Pseudonocardia endophytica]
MAAAAAAAVALLAASACGSGGAGASSTALSVGIASNFFSTAWDQRVDPGATAGVSFRQFDGAGPVYEALRAGAVDIGFGSDISTIASQAGGADVTILGVARPDPKWLRLIVPQGSPVRSLTDLRGRSIAVVKGSAAHRFITAEIARAKLSVHDFDLRFLATADAQTAFRTGGVDAWAAWEPNAAQLEQQNGARLVQTAVPETAGAIYLASKGDIVAPGSPKRDAALAFTDAFVRTLDRLKADPQGWSQTLAADLKLDPQVALQFARNYTFTFVPVDDRARQDYRTTAAELQTLGIITQQPDPATAFTDQANEVVTRATAATG